MISHFCRCIYFLIHLFFRRKNRFFISAIQKLALTVYCLIKKVFSLHQFIQFLLLHRRHSALLLSLQILLNLRYLLFIIIFRINTACSLCKQKHKNGQHIRQNRSQNRRDKNFHKIHTKLSNNRHFFQFHLYPIPHTVEIYCIPDSASANFPRIFLIRSTTVVLSPVPSYPHTLSYICSLVNTCPA